MTVDRGDETVTVRFPGLSAGEAAAVVRELEVELLAAGAPAADLRIDKENAETMDFGATLMLGAGVLGWEFLKSFAKGFASEAGAVSGRLAYDALRRKIDDFCRRRCVPAELSLPGGATYILRSEFERSDAVAGVPLPRDLGTLGVVILGASVFPHLEGLNNPAFARSAGAAKRLFDGAAGPFRKVAVLDLFDSDLSPPDVVGAIEHHIGSYPDMADLLIYYCGHGNFLRDRTYYLTLKSTREHREASTGLKLKDLRHDLEAQLASRRLYLVLDCCYAAAAVQEFMGSNVDQVVADALVEAMPARGWLVLAAASKSTVAMAPKGEDLTMFTGALAEVLGAATQPLSFDDIAIQTRHAIQRRWGDRGIWPECHAPFQSDGDLRRVRLFGGGMLAAQDEMAAAPAKPAKPAKQPAEPAKAPREKKSAPSEGSRERGIFDLFLRAQGASAIEMKSAGFTDVSIGAYCKYFSEHFALPYFLIKENGKQRGYLAPLRSPQWRRRLLRPP